MPAMRPLLFILIFTFLLGFSSKAQPFQNSSFEDVEDSIPENWSLSAFGAKASEDYASEGQYALSVWNWYYYGKGAAVLGAGEPPFLMEHAGLPFQGEPQYLTGTYAYITGETYSTDDRAVIGIALKKFNTLNNTSDTIASGEIRLSPSASVSSFEVPINYRSFDLCDTLVVWVISSDSGFCGANSGGECLHLYVDNLVLQSNSSTSSQAIDSWFGASAILQPNPAESYFSVATRKKLQSIELYSLTGQLLRSENQNLNGNIDVSMLPAGIYMVQINYADNARERQKLVIR